MTAALRVFSRMTLKYDLESISLCCSAIRFSRRDLCNRAGHLSEAVKRWRAACLACRLASLLLSEAAEVQLVGTFVEVAACICRGDIAPSDYRLLEVLVLLSYKPQFGQRLANSKKHKVAKQWHLAAANPLRTQQACLLRPCRATSATTLHRRRTG